MATVDLDLLARFVAVVDAASYSAAALKLGLPKSTLSRSVASLERSMGVQLLHRSTRRVAVSSAGAALHERAAPLLADLQRALGELPEREEQPAGRLRVTATVDFGAAVLADIVARFVARYPGVEVDMRLANNLVDLVGDGIDVALRLSGRRLADATFTAKKLGMVSIQLYAAPAYLTRRGTPRSPRELADHTWVRYRGATRLQLEGPGDPHTVRPAGAIVCDDMSFARAALCAGAGVGMLPTFVAEADLAAGRLVRVVPRWTIPAGYLWCVCPGGRPPRKVSAFRDFLTEALRQNPYTLAP